MKDPAFLFYSNDWIGGTMGMTFEQKGAYIELLMTQFNRGHMTSDMIARIVGHLWVEIKEKFVIDEDGLFYNKRLEEEQNKRKTFTESRRNNLKGLNQYKKNGGHMRGHMSNHMENENENENININKDSIKEEEKEIEKTWRNDYSIYLQECKKGYRELIENKKFIEHIQKLQPKLNVLASIEMSFHSYWGTEDGWRNKKAKKSKTINWKSTILKNLKFNSVYN